LGQEQAKLFSQVELYYRETLEMIGLFDEFFLSVMEYLVDKLSGH